LTKDGEALDQAIAALTAANAATQIDVIAAKLNQMSIDTSAQAKKLNASGSIGMLEITGLLSTATQTTWTNLLNHTLQVVTQTSTDIAAKKDIVKNSGKTDVLAKAIRAQKKGIMDIVSVIPGQIPPAVKNGISSMAAKAASSAAAAAATASPGAAAPPKMPKMPDMNDPKLQETLSKAIDGILDQIIAVVEGKQEGFTLPAGMPTPPAGFKGAGGLPGGIPTGAPAAPKASAPAMDGMAGMAGMPGMPAATPKAAAPKPAAPKATALPKVTGLPVKGAKGPAVQGDFE